VLRWKPKLVYLLISTDGARFLKKNGDRFEPVCADLKADFSGFPSVSEAALTQLLLSRNLAGCVLHVVVSDLLVHYFITQAAQGLRSVGELQQLAEVRHSRLYDSVPAEWKVVIDLDSRHSAYLCCALQQAMLSGLARAAHAAGISIRSVQPALVASQRLVAKRITGETAWYVRIDDQSCTIGYKNANGWAGIRVHQSSPDTLDALIRLLKLDRLYFGGSDDQPQTAWLFGASHLPQDGEDEQWTIRELGDPFSAAPDERDAGGAAA
jgi:hypothetical protein